MRRLGLVKPMTNHDGDLSESYAPNHTDHAILLTFAWLALAPNTNASLLNGLATSMLLHPPFQSLRSTGGPNI